MIVNGFLQRRFLGTAAGFAVEARKNCWRLALAQRRLMMKETHVKH